MGSDIAEHTEFLTVKARLISLDIVPVSFDPTWANPKVIDAATSQFSTMALRQGTPFVWLGVDSTL